MPDPFDDIPRLPETHLYPAGDEPPETHLYPAGDEPFRDANEEALFQQALPPFEKPPDPTAGSHTLVILFVLYVLWQTVAGPRGFDIHWLATLLGIILFHEVGHYLGMVLFGYRNVQIFFIPFFGAGTAGVKHAAPGWQESIVILLGPLPGIILAGLLYAVARPNPDPQLREAIILLLLINGFNLLPLLPFDGGRLLSVLAFSRWAVLEAFFQVAAAAGLAFLAYHLEWWFLYLIAVLELVTLRTRYWLRKNAAEYQFASPDVPRDIEALSRPEQRELFCWIREIFPGTADANLVAAHMRALHQMAVTEPPSVLASFGFFALYLLGFAACIGILFWMGQDARP